MRPAAMLLGVAAAAAGVLPVAAVVARQAAAPPSATTPLIMLEDSRARCMDGSQGGIYVRRATNPSASTKWIFTLQGGGECVTERRCKPAATSSPLGSSKYFKSNYTFWGDSSTHFIDASCTGNPTLCDYNFVFMPYCSQDLW